MKKIIISLLIVFTALGLLYPAAYAEEPEITVLIDGEKIEFDVPPMIVDERTLVPLRAIFENLGATVDYDDSTLTITAQKDDVHITLVIDNQDMQINDKTITLDVPPTVINDRTLVPVRAISEAFNCKVDWNEETSTVSITTIIAEDIIPYIDFTNDDGTMGVLHVSVRHDFEQKTLPEVIYQDKDATVSVLINDPEGLVAAIDDQAWTQAMYGTVVKYMIEAEETFVIETTEDMFSAINELADKYSLHAYQAYTPEAVKLSDTTYCMLLAMSDISNAKVDEMTKLLLSKYVAIVYDTNTKELHYFTLEKSFDGIYMLCSVSEDFSHTTYGIVNPTKTDFLIAVSDLVQ